MGDKKYLLVNDGDENIAVLELEKDNVTEESIRPKLIAAVEEHYVIDGLELSAFDQRSQRPSQYTTTLKNEDNEYVIFLEEIWVY